MSESSLDKRRLLKLLGTLVFLASCGLLLAYGGASALLLLLSASALSLTIFFLWNSLQLTDRGDEMDFEEALALAAPSATEEQKRAILRTLKDLEYELSVGKISQEDFDQVSAEYRAEAKRLIYAHDEEMRARLRHAEELVKSRLAREHIEKREPKQDAPNEESLDAPDVPDDHAPQDHTPDDHAPDDDTPESGEKTGAESPSPPSETRQEPAEPPSDEPEKKTAGEKSP